MKNRGLIEADEEKFETDFVANGFPRLKNRGLIEATAYGVAQKIETLLSAVEKPRPH